MSSTTAALNGLIEQTHVVAGKKEGSGGLCKAVLNAILSLNSHFSLFSGSATYPIIEGQVAAEHSATAPKRHSTTNVSVSRDTRSRSVSKDHVFTGTGFGLLLMSRDGWLCNPRRRSR